MIALLKHRISLLNMANNSLGEKNWYSHFLRRTNPTLHLDMKSQCNSNILIILDFSGYVK